MPEPGQRSRLWLRRWRWRAALVLVALALVSLAVAWLSRDRIASNVLDDQLKQSGLEATYDIVSIGPNRQVIENLIIGDPEAPDLTAERVTTSIDYGVFSAGLGQIEVTGARFFGSYRDGVVSFGSLDTLLFAESDEPAGLPEFDVKLTDARGRIESDFGVIGLKLDGEGLLSDGFAGKLAATAPSLSIAGCNAHTATLYGDLTTPGGVPRFSGPVRIRDAQCGGVELERADIAADLAIDPGFTAVDGNFDFVAEKIGGFGAAGEELRGTADLTWRDGETSFQHDLIATQVSSQFGVLDQLTLDGMLRSAGDPDRSDWSARIEGEGVSLALENSALGDAREGAQGTLFAPILAKLERNLSRTVQGGRLGAEITIRQSQDGTTVIVPEARLRASGGETLVAVSRLSWTSSGRLSANLATSGEGLPKISGRMQQVGSGDLAFTLEMQEYSAGQDRVAIPQLTLRSRPDGSYLFDGLVNASGAIPGGGVEELEVPVNGTYSSRGELAIGAKCTAVRFDRLSYYELTLGGRSVTLCPQDGQPIFSYSDTARFAAQSAALSLTGELAETELVLDAEAARFAYPGEFSLSGVTATMGSEGNAVRLTSGEVAGAIGDTISGSFSDATAKLDVVPLDIDQLAGDWRYEDEVLVVDRAAFRLTERTEDGVLARFEPLFARDGALALNGNDLTATATLRERATDRMITSIDIGHNLASGTGQADLNIPGVVFDDALQPDQLTYLASGVIAEADGVISGEGRVDWTVDDLTSTGTFTTDDFDFAAAFGPVSSVRGTMRFADLLAMTTERGQVLEVGSVNPGIEVLGGKVVYDLRDGQVLNVEDASWPFMGGRLILRPVTLDYGKPGSARYVFELVGLDAATFVTQMELTNLGASGTFDGTVPVVFDSIGNGRIEGGLLISRPPGGNVAYIGELTYEDLGTMGNYAFQSLRSLDYTQMSVGLNGDLAGEIITNFQFDGISQGEGTTQNFVTRQLAKLPIRFKINVRSENFYELSTVVRSFFDPEFLGNPVDRGLFNTRDGVLVPRDAHPVPSPEPDPEDPVEVNEATRQDESAVQPPESEEMQ